MCDGDAAWNSSIPRDIIWITKNKRKSIQGIKKDKRKERNVYKIQLKSFLLFFLR